MKILGIDPGTAVMGYGLIESEGDKLVPVDFGAFIVPDLPGEGTPAFEYTPAQVKLRVANYGASGKEQVQEMVRLLLGLAQVPEPNDAADALAVAICHVQETHLNNLLTMQEKRE
jgi:Holliday junction resolvasome RuvABC endonuclease subunit